MGDVRAEVQSTGMAGDASEPTRRLLREEAHRMPFDDLLQPERRAVLNLLQGLVGALDSPEAQAHRGDATLAPTFFLSGQRGSGKSTVLVNGRFAVEDPDAFFGPIDRVGDGGEDRDQRRLVQRLRPHVSRLGQHVIWLDPLDMEFFQENGNLLTTLLVRLRNALVAPFTSSSGDRHVAQRRTKVLEEVDDAWTQIDELIKDATVMWESIPDPSAARRAELEIRSAETNADFQARFQAALKAVCMQLGRRRYQEDGCVSLILPIDNADRSSRHVFQIVRLIRMVSCSRLWYVLAGSEADLDVFLERSYHEQLRTTGAGDQGAAAEALQAIARRQAAADARAVFPPASRSSIGPIPATEALSFNLRDGLRLREALERLTLANGEPSKRERRAPRNLLQLLCADWVEDARLDGHRGADGDVPMSQAGEAALKVPARAVVDTCHLAQLWLDRQQESGRNAASGSLPSSWGALGFIHAVLQHAIGESELPMWASRRLCQIITEDGQGRIGLDLRDEPLEWRSRFRLQDTLELGAAQRYEQEPAELAHGTRVEIRLYDHHGIALHLRQGDRSIELPGQVSGWLRVLHDVLRQDDAPRIMEASSSHTGRRCPLLVQTWIESPIWRSEPGGREMAKLALSWRAPDLDSFFDYDVLARRWAEFRLKRLPRRLASHQPRSESLCALLLNGWIDVIESVIAHRGLEWEPKGFDESERQDLRKRLDDVYLNVTEADELDQPIERARAVRNWMEHGLPLLLRPEIIWMTDVGEWSWAKHQEGERSRLQTTWQRRRGEIFAARYAAFADALEQSDTYRSYLPHMSSPRGLDYHALHRWLRRACDRWFRGVFALERSLRPADLAAWYPQGAVWSPLGPLARTPADALDKASKTPQGPPGVTTH